MLLWIIVTIIAYFLNAIVSIVDKHIVSNAIFRPVAYTFYSGFFQIIFIALIPIIGFTVPKTNFFILGILNGILFIIALLIFYKALKSSETSRIVPLVGSVVPIFTIFLSYIILGEVLTIKQFFAFIFFILGGFILSSKLDNGKFFVIKGFSLALTAGFLFALYYTLMKYLYMNISFFEGFILVQIGGVFGALFLLLSKQNRKTIFSISEITKKGATYLFISNKILAFIASILIFYAISIQASNITIINSLQSTQYIFILLFAIILSKKLPKLYHEQVSENVIMQKIGALLLIGVGLLLLG